MIFEAMEESGSFGLDELIVAEKDGFLANVDAICISDNYWLSTTKPCITVRFCFAVLVEEVA